MRDARSGDTLRWIFSTTSAASGAPATLSGSPVISVYKDANTTQVTTGVTLTVDYDGVTGLNLLEIATSDAFYSRGSDFAAIITAGTVDGISVVGSVVALFSVEKYSPLDHVASSHGTAGSVGAQLQPIYTAVIGYQRGETEGLDRYTVYWLKNGERLTSGITSPTLTVTNRSTEAALLSAVAMTDAGSGNLKYVTTSASQRQTLGIPYLLATSATIDGATRTWIDANGRDI